MDFRVLGPLIVEDEQGPLQLDGPRVRALLAFLLLRANTAVSTADLLDELWGDEPPKSGATAVQNAVARLRKTLGDRVVTTPGGYLVRVEPGELDLDRFHGLVAAASEAPPPDRARMLREGLALWRGEPLASLGTAAFVDRARAHLEDERRGALADRVDADLAAGRHAELVPELSALAAEHPLDERFRGQLILALYRSGRQAAALDVYRETRRTLADELGLEPSPALRELERAILRQDPALDAPAQPIAAGEPTGPRRRRLVWLVGLAALFAAGAATAVVLDARSGGREAAPAASSHTQSRPLHSTSATSTQKPPRPRHKGHAIAHRGRTSTAEATTAAVVETHPTTSKQKTTAATTTARTTTKATTTVRKSGGSQKTRTVTTTTSTSGAGGGIDGPPLISETFDGKVDESLWHVFTQGGGSQATQRNGRVEISIPANATPSDNYGQISGDYEVRCLFPGDFDAAVDFELLQWPRASGANATLVARVGPLRYTPRYIFPSIRRSSLPGGEEQYQSYLFTGDAQVASDDRSGRLRLARRNDVMTTYYWKRDRWVKVDSAQLPGLALIYLETITDDASFGRVDVATAFDNFILFAGRADC